MCYFSLLPLCYGSGLHKDINGVLHALLPNSPPHLVEIAALNLVFNYISMKLVKKKKKSGGSRGERKPQNLVLVILAIFVFYQYP